MATLSIDFDIIMEPSLNLFNELIDDDTTIDDIMKEYPFASNPPVNLSIYEYLTSIICRAASDKIPVYFIDSHEEIIKLFKEWGEDELNDGDDIINIDFHHDVGYDIDFKRTSRSYDCSNWVKYGKEHHCIKKYTWVHGKNSYFPEDQEGMKFIDEHYNLDKLGYEIDLEEADIRKIFICASFNWVPVEYQPLYTAWKNAIEVIEDY